MLFMSCVCHAFASVHCCRLLFVMMDCVFVNFPCDILGQVWYLIVSIPDLCRLSYFHTFTVLIIYYFWMTNTSLFCQIFLSKVVIFYLKWDSLHVIYIIS